MAAITYITSCMGRLEFLKRTLPAVIAQSDAAVVVVDYSCPQRCGRWVEAVFPQARVVRVERQTRFNLAHARNAGADACQTPWLGFLDADILLAPTFSKMVLPNLRPGVFYQASPMPRDWHLMGTVLCSLEDFKAVEKYDEVMQGWGGEDRDLYQRFHLHGIQEDSFPGVLVSHLDHGDALRVQHYDLKDKRGSQTINRFYMVAKADLMRLSGEPLNLERRRQLYDEVERLITQASAAMGEGHIQIALPPSMSLVQQPRRLTFEHEAAHAVAGLAGGGTINHIDVTVHYGPTSVSMGNTSWHAGPDIQNAQQVGWIAGPAQHAIACERLGESVLYAVAAADRDAGQIGDFLSARGRRATKAGCRRLIDKHMRAVTEWLLRPEVQLVIQALADELAKHSGIIEWAKIPAKIRTANLPALPRIAAMPTANQVTGC